MFLTFILVIGFVAGAQSAPKIITGEESKDPIKFCSVKKPEFTVKSYKFLNDGCRFMCVYQNTSKKYSAYMEEKGPCEIQGEKSLCLNNQCVQERDYNRCIEALGPNEPLTEFYSVGCSYMCKSKNVELPLRNYQKDYATCLCFKPETCRCLDGQCVSGNNICIEPTTRIIQYTDAIIRDNNEADLTALCKEVKGPKGKFIRVSDNTCEIICDGDPSGKAAYKEGLPCGDPKEKTVCFRGYCIPPNANHECRNVAGFEPVNITKNDEACNYTCSGATGKNYTFKPYYCIPPTPAS